MNLNSIKSDEFKNVFELWWEIRKFEIQLFTSVSEWWKLTKIKLNSLTIDISKRHNRLKKIKIKFRISQI